MSIAFVQQSSGGAVFSGVSTKTWTVSAGTSGNTLIFCYYYGANVGATIFSITQTNVTWTFVKKGTLGVGRDCEIWQGVIAGGSSGTSLTVLLTGGNYTRAAYNLSEYSGVANTGDGTGSGTGTGTAVDTNSTTQCTTTQANDLLVACVGFNATTTPSGTPGGNYTNLTFATDSGTIGLGSAYAITNSVGNQSPTWTITSAAWISCIVAFKSSSNAYTSTLTDTVTLTETFTKGTVRHLTDAATVTDTFVKGTVRNLTDTVTVLNELFTLGVGLLFIEPGFAITDTLTRGATRLLTDTVALIDNVTKGISRSWTETIQLLEQFGDETALTFNEVFNLVDYFLIHKALDNAVMYFRRYLSDVTPNTPVSSVPNGPSVTADGIVSYLKRYLSYATNPIIPINESQPVETETPDPAIGYFRQYLGRI